MHPGDPKKLSGFELFDKRESHCTAYFGYSDARDLRMGGPRVVVVERLFATDVCQE